jgi:superfamily II DNA/RNA helicase
MPYKVHSVTIDVDALGVGDAVDIPDIISESLTNNPMMDAIITAGETMPTHVQMRQRPVLWAKNWKKYESLIRFPYDILEALLKKDPVLAYKVRKNLPPNKSESRNLNAFLAAVRQISNTPASYTNDPVEIAAAPKLQSIVNHVIDKSGDKGYKAVIYSNYLESGINPIKEALDAEGVSNATFSGKLNDKQRKQVVEDYNSGKVKALLVTGAGSEGLDLKGTTEMHVVEPHWNDARIDQVIGRAARYQSHSHLPEDKQKLIVYKYQATPKPSFLQKLLKNVPTGADEYLEGLSEKKTKLNEQFLEAIKEASLKNIKFAKTAAKLPSLMPSLKRFASTPRDPARLIMKRVRGAVRPELPPMAEKLRQFNKPRI